METDNASVNSGSASGMPDGDDLAPSVDGAGGNANGPEQTQPAPAAGKSDGAEEKKEMSELA